MHRRVIFMPEARVEMVEAQDWHEVKADRLGVAYRHELERVVEGLVENPMHFPIMVRDVRRARLIKFPYALYFRSMPDGVVLACFHSRRDPQSSQARN